MTFKTKLPTYFTSYCIKLRLLKKFAALNRIKKQQLMEYDEEWLGYFGKHLLEVAKLTSPFTSISSLEQQIRLYVIYIKLHLHSLVQASRRL